MKKRMFIMLILCLIVFGGIVGFFFFKISMMKKYMGKFAPPPAVVTTLKATQVDWHPSLTAVGTLVAVQSVEIAPQIGGQIIKIYFNSGDYIAKGTPLVDLDISTEIAQLKADQAQLKQAQLSYARIKKLFKTGSISPADVDNALAALQAKEAAVEGDRAVIAKMHIVAPFAGKLGIREVSLGQYIAPPPASGGNIVQLTSIDPIFVQFDLPQQNLPQVQVGQAIQLTTDALPNKEFMGNITALNASVSADSRTLTFQGQVSNNTHQLLPGMFVTTNVFLPIEKNILIVPQTAVVSSLYGDSIYVVKQDAASGDKPAGLHVEQVFVTVGQRQGINVVISAGLTAGDEVVTSGQLKLHNHESITVNNAVQPK
ncbi:MAG: efflux RND transporter periplasmic adaptor subunit [Gammaproteobacteria bacterium]|nr:efflux RND transporter periplasmic adaptor subunit [Gammaproteobacteria bacterium]